MKLSLNRLVLLVCALDAATSLAASIPFYASSNIRFRNIESRNVKPEVLDVHFHNTEAREPTTAELAAAVINLEKRNPVGVVVQVGKMIGEVIMKIKQAFAADKEVCYPLFKMYPSNANNNSNSTVAAGRKS